MMPNGNIDMRGNFIHARKADMKVRMFLLQTRPMADISSGLAARRNLLVLSPRRSECFLRLK